jgi:Zn-dependent M28 family amino/carboxypeptidase/dienelactone hydrolase
MDRQLRLSLVLPAAVAVWAALSSPSRATEPVLPAIDGAAVLEHTKVLASDAFEGRAPGTKGEELTVAYLVEQLTKIGLRPGNPDGTWVQKVPLVGTTVQGSPALTFRKGATERRLAWREDHVAWTKRVAERVSLDASDLVFVGYGVQAPEFQWDDYKGVDVRGKTMVVLVGDPPVADPANPAELDPKAFGGKAMTYYGRWTYKYEMGAKLGAAGVLVVHETEPAGYPFAIIQGKTTEQFDLETPDGNAGRAAVEGWITLDQARGLFEMAGQSFEALRKSAAKRDFRPVPLGATASVSLVNTIRRIPSANVVAKIEGSDAALRDQWVVYTTHWDHFGVGPAVNGERIYRGAIDNASGTAGLVELARAMNTATPKPRRSILFLFVTAEEQGLLGSTWYAERPLYPLSRTVAVLNLDALNVHGRTRDLTVVGLGLSSLDEVVGRAAAAQGRAVRPDPTPEKGSYYRSDHFPFARKGVPSIHAGGGIEYLGQPAGFGARLREAYIRNDYHKPSDAVRPDWEMSGAVEDLDLYLRTGYELASGSAWPEWKPGAEWKRERDATMKGTGIHHHPGSDEALPHQKYLRVVSEADSPVQQTYIKAKDGLYVAAAIRKPSGDGPFPAIIMFHGAPGGRGMEQLVGWSRGATGGPVWERFLREGFVVAVADYRGGNWNTMNVPSSGGHATAIDDGLAVIDFVKGLPYVDGSRLSLYGVSLGGNLVAYLVSKVPTIQAAILGAPAPIWFLGMQPPAGGGRPDLSTLKPDPAIAAANIAPIRTPVLILVGTEDGLLPLATTLHDLLREAGKPVRMDVYAHGYHDFVLGPQGQNRPDLPRGEILLAGALEALDQSVAFVKAASPGER